MNRVPSPLRALMTRIDELKSQKKFGEARRLLRSELAVDDSLSARVQKTLLTGLAQLEVEAGHPRNALLALNRLGVLGFNDWTEKLDSHLQAATLLARSCDWISARAEVCKIFEHRRHLEWSNLLSAIDFYFEVDKECRRHMEEVLETAFEATLKQHGIQRPASPRKESLEVLVKKMRTSYRAEAKEFQNLLLKAYTETSHDERCALESELRRFADVAQFELFKSQARKLAAQLQVKVK